MLRFKTMLPLVTLMSFALWITGCGDTQSAKNPAGTSTTEKKPKGSESQGKSASDKLAANLAKLSPEDRAAAEKQGTCPVTGSKLGKMGTPIKLDVDGHTVFICCKSCEEDLLNDHGKYLVKLGFEHDDEDEDNEAKKEDKKNHDHKDHDENHKDHDH